MANSLNGQVDMSFRPVITGSFGTLSPLISLSLSLANGTAINQADQSYFKERSVSTNDDIDLIGGGLVDAAGSTFGPTKIVAMAVKNLSSTAGEILTVGGASNTFTSWLTGSNAGIKLGPGGMFLIADPSLAAYGVTATSADNLRISAATGTISYLLGLLGRT